MSVRYEFARSKHEKSLLLVFPEGTFEGLPFEIRLAAPWVGNGYGDLSELKPHDKRHLHQFGYTILREQNVRGESGEGEGAVGAGDEMQVAA